jgi:hypothetical protein
MKRDMEMVRLILLWIESGEEPAELRGTGEAVKNYHLDIMIEAGLLKGHAVQTPGKASPGSVVQRLTWEGHDFLDATKDPGIWQKAKDKVMKPGAALTFGILLEFLKAEAKHKLGLP